MCRSTNGHRSTVEDLSVHFLWCSSLSPEELVQHVSSHSTFSRNHVSKIKKESFPSRDDEKSGIGI